MTPNTRKPTKKEVGDTDSAWHWCCNNPLKWRKSKGWNIRWWWSRGDAWLPYHAIPDPNNTQQGEAT